MEGVSLLVLMGRTRSLSYNQSRPSGGIDGSRVNQTSSFHCISLYGELSLLL